MPLIPNFTVSQIPATPSNITLTDTSTGSDPAISSRRVFVETSQGSFLVLPNASTDYSVWAYPDPSITLDLLTEDQAVNVNVQWVDAFGNILYQKNTNYCFSQYNQQYFYYLVQVQSQTYNIIQDNRYWQNMNVYYANIVGAIKAVELGNDIFGSQECLNRATYMQTNATNFF